MSTDPPYYDNVPYSDLSDFFYVWLRHNLSDVWPDEFATILTPKAEELVADNQRLGSRHAAEEYFESGMLDFMRGVSEAQTPEVPATIFYAYKATESRDGEAVSTGWDTFLQAILDSGMVVTATWPMRTEMPGGTRMVDRNALSSSVVLACRPRSPDSALGTRAEFVGELRHHLPDALKILQSGSVAPVDLAQAAMGPGIRVFSQYARVVEADGTAMPVRRALVIINDLIGEILDGGEAELDPNTRFALTWYSENGYQPGPFGDADNLARAKNTSVQGTVDAGIGDVRDGEFRLLQRSELAAEWRPVSDERRTVWKSAQYLSSALERSESEAATLLAQLGGYGDRARQLAYVLFQRASDKGWAREAGVYNSLIAAWPKLLQATGVGDDQQQLL